MRIVLANLFVLMGAALVVAITYIFLQPLGIFGRAGLEMNQANCGGIATQTSTGLIFFLVAASLVLAHLLVEEEHRSKLRVPWGGMFVLLTLSLVFVQFMAFQTNTCDRVIPHSSKILMTTLTAALIIFAIRWLESKALGAAFLLISAGLIAALSLSVLKIGPTALSAYGYGCLTSLLVILATAGTAMTLGLRGSRATTRRPPGDRSG